MIVRILLIVVFLALAVGLFFATDIAALFAPSDIQTKGTASEIGEWVKLAGSVVSLFIGLINLRLLMKTERAE